MNRDERCGIFSRVTVRMPCGCSIDELGLPVRRPPAAFEVCTRSGRVGHAGLASGPAPCVHALAVVEERDLDAGVAAIDDRRVDLAVKLSEAPEALSVRPVAPDSCHHGA